MNILQWNVRGFLSHCGEFKQIMLKEAPLIAAVQETHLRDQDPYNFNVHGYSFYTDNINSEHRQGGVGLYVSNGLLQTPLKLHTPLNAVGVKVRLCAREITVISIYYPPNSPLVFLSNLDNLIHQVPKPCLLLGDLNAHHPIWGSRRASARGRSIEELLEKYDLTFLNDGSPTFFSSSHLSYSAIDLSLASASIAPLFEWRVQSDPYFSDHFPIQLFLPETPSLISGNSTKKWNLSLADWSLYNHSITRGRG